MSCYLYISIVCLFFWNLFLIRLSISSLIGSQEEETAGLAVTLPTSVNSFQGSLVLNNSFCCKVYMYSF